MSITAQLRDSVNLPGGGALVNGYAYESRGDGQCRALLLNGHDLEVHDVHEVLAGERAPTAVFPLPWPGWDHGVHSVSPDGSFAAFSGQRAVRAVGRGGETLWEYRHGCWGPEVGHPHSGDEQEVCRGLESGSCRISDDGRFVWAHVVATTADAGPTGAGEGPETGTGEHPGEEDAGAWEVDGGAGAWEERWVVLDARDGRELARLPLASAAAGSHHLSHPDGVHMGLSIGMGQDGVLLYWARWDGEKLTAWDLDETAGRILTDVHPGHPGFLTTEHYGEDLRLHSLDGAVLATAEPEPADEEPPCWDYGCGFVDADTVIASTLDSCETPEDGGHWLLDARTLEIRGPVAYPEGTGAAHSYVRPLGDGTWLTYDDGSGTLYRWGCRGE
ncbi:hypothetical protein [Streptomyces sp. NPDC002328]|uniref:hypothetical protein n=1 Tax=Streptomyces sp. NPDC002328 TaxID=3364642 RepID=UPI0036BD6DE7